jgi:mycofactocin precursor
MDHNLTTDTTVTDEGQLDASDLIEEVSIDGMCGVY